MRCSRKQVKQTKQLVEVNEKNLNPENANTTHIGLNESSFDDNKEDAYIDSKPNLD